MQNKNKLLLLLFLVVLFKQLVWIALIPLWHTPDEQAHFAQVQNIAEKNTLKSEGQTTSREIEISERLLNVKRNSGGENNFTYHPEFRIDYTRGFAGKYEKKINTIDVSERKNLVIREASGYPPLYYQISAFAYNLVYDSSLINRVFFIRIFQSFIYVLTILIYFLLAKEILDKKKALFFSVFISFLPMPSFVAAGITSDNFMNMLFPLGLYIGMLIVKYGIKIKYLFAFGALSLMGGLTKPHFIIILPIIWFVILFSSFQTRNLKKFVLFNLLCIISVPFLIWKFFPTYLHDFLVTGNIFLLFPEIGSLSGAFSENKMSIFGYLVLTLQKTYRETIPWFWGIFRWLSLTLDRWFYRTWNFITVLSIIFFALRLRKKIKIEMVYLISSVVIYFLVLFLWDYLFFLGHGFSFGIQGRYYFPILFPIAFFIYYYFSFRKILPFLAVVFNMYAIFKISAFYYSTSSIGDFIIQASQYKPWFFKGNFLSFWIATYLILLVIFLVKLIRWKE